MRLSFALILLSLAGCVDDNVSLFIRDNIAPEQDDDGCTFSAASNETILSGLWDVTAADNFVGVAAGGYALTVAVVNQIQARATTVASEPNGVHMQSAEVEILRDGNQPDLGDLPNPFSVPVSGFIPPSDGFDSPGISTVTIPSAIPADYRAALAALVTPTNRPTLVLRVRLRGKTNGQIDVLTDEWEYPVELCEGCLITCTTEPMDVAFACRPGQDQGSLVMCP